MLPFLQQHLRHIPPSVKIRVDFLTTPPPHSSQPEWRAPAPRNTWGGKRPFPPTQHPSFPVKPHTSPPSPSSTPPAVTSCCWRESTRILLEETNSVLISDKQHLRHIPRRSKSVLMSSNNTSALPPRFEDAEAQHFRHEWRAPAPRNTWGGKGVSKGGNRGWGKGNWGNGGWNGGWECDRNN